MPKEKAPDTQSTVYQNTLPEYAEPYFKDLMDRSRIESTRGYKRYPRKRLAGYSPEERAVHGGIRDLAAAGSRPELGMARRQYERGAQGVANVGKWDQEAYDRYANPFFQNVVDVEKEEAIKQAAIQEKRARADAFASDAYGGYRDAIMSGMREAGLHDDLRAIQAAGSRDAWESGRAAFQSDEDRALVAAQIEAEIGTGLQQLALTQQNQAIERLTALEQIGVSQREMEQAAFDLAYADWLEAQSWERTQLVWLGGQLHGIPVASNQTVTQKTPGPSMASQIGGGVVAGLGTLTSAFDAFS